MIPTNCISATHTSWITCSPPKGIAKCLWPRNERELPLARSMFVLTCLRVEHCVSGTAGLTIVMLAHVSTTSTPRLLPFTRGPSSLSATFFTAGWSIRSLTLWVAARLWLMTLAGTRFQASVVFFPGNHTAYGQGHHKWSNPRNWLAAVCPWNGPIHHRPRVTMAVLILQGVG